MSRKVMMGSQALVAISGVLLSLGLCPAVVGESNDLLRPGPGEAANTTDYLNMMGYEGIPTLGDQHFVNGTPPPVADWITTHCRYINIGDPTLGDYYLRYPLHLPDGARIQTVGFRVADFADTGDLFVYLRSRPWNSRAKGDIEAQTKSSNLFQSDQTFFMHSVDLDINNTTRAYWIDVTPGGGVIQEELCVYGIHVTYLTPYIFGDGFESGDKSGWSSAVE